MNFLQQLDMFFSVANGLVFAVVCLLVIIVVELRKSLGLNVTHYQRTDMVDMSLSANEYMIHLRNGDIRGEWKPVFNGKFLPLDAGVMEAHLAAKAECELKDMLTEAYAMNDQWDEDNWHRYEADAHYAEEEDHYTMYGDKGTVNVPSIAYHDWLLKVKELGGYFIQPEEGDSFYVECWSVGYTPQQVTDYLNQPFH